MPSSILTGTDRTKQNQTTTYLLSDPQQALLLAHGQWWTYHCFCAFAPLIPPFVPLLCPIDPPLSVQCGKHQHPRQCSFHHAGLQCPFHKLSQAPSLKDTQIQDLACVNIQTPVAGWAAKHCALTAAPNYFISGWTCVADTSNQWKQCWAATMSEANFQQNSNRILKSKEKYIKVCFHLGMSLSNHEIGNH